MKIVYENKRFGPAKLKTIAQANEILEEYERQGYDLTLRQLYYQFVSRDLIPNNERSYKNLGTTINDARLAGLIDWDHIVDRTRNVRSVQHWADPAAIIDATARSFRVSLWEAQNDYVEVWIEKDALVGVIIGICTELDVPYFSCRGYTSQSEMWAAAQQRLLGPVTEGKRVTILHLGDHDPSGIDMTRDIQDRLQLFIATDYARNRGKADPRWDSYSEVNQDLTLRQWVNEAYDRLTINRIALTMSQVNQYNPPPNFAKLSDSRAGVRKDGSVIPGGYVDTYGWESWELDALEPAVLIELIRSNVEDLIDDGAWDAAKEREEEGQRLLRLASTRWTEIVEGLNGAEPEDADG
jgi:hypothetical protein